MGASMLHHHVQELLANTGLAFVRFLLDPRGDGEAAQMMYFAGNRLHRLSLLVCAVLDVSNC